MFAGKNNKSISYNEGSKWTAERMRAMLPKLDESITQNWTEEMRHMVALKAALWTNGNEQKLLDKALREYREDIPLMKQVYCAKCGQEAKEILADFETASGVTIAHVPTIVCDHCGNKAWRLFVIAELERMAEHMEPGAVTTLECMLQQ
ncbi:MAG: hypothetical protein ACYCYO_01460 [Bacilli bacterium]